MNIVQLSSSDKNGGAAKAAFRLNESLINFRQDSLNSFMRVSNQTDDHYSILSPKLKINKLLSTFRSALGSYINTFQKSHNPTKHSCCFLPSLLPQELNNSFFDLAHIHWVQSEMISIEGIGKIKKPKVMTLHDCWAFSGSEHFPLDLEDKRYKQGYFKSNKNINNKGLDLDRWCWNRKKKVWKKPFQLVAPSNWMANMAKDSALMHNWPVKVIPNPLPTNVYKPFDKLLARDLLELPIDKKLIMFAANSGTREKRKGWDLFYKAIKYLETKLDNFEIVILGKSNPGIKLDTSIKVHYMSKLYDDISISCLMNAMDIVAVPSLMDVLPQVANEAQSCGIPVVAFKVTGLVDCVEDKKTGYLAEPFDYKDFAQGIIWLLNNNIEGKISKNARDRALNRWSYEKVSYEYQNLYNEVIEGFKIKNL